MYYSNYVKKFNSSKSAATLFILFVCKFSVYAHTCLLFTIQSCPVSRFMVSLLLSQGLLELFSQNVQLTFRFWSRILIIIGSATEINMIPSQNGFGKLVCLDPFIELFDIQFCCLFSFIHLTISPSLFWKREFYINLISWKLFWAVQEKMYLNFFIIKFDD